MDVPESRMWVHSSFCRFNIFVVCQSTAKIGSLENFQPYGYVYVYIPSAIDVEAMLGTGDKYLMEKSLKCGWYFLLSPLKVTSSTALLLALLPSAAMENRGGYVVACSKSSYHSIPRFWFQNSISEADIYIPIPTWKFNDSVK